MLNKLCKTLMVGQNKRGNEQQGFMPRKSTIDAVFALRLWRVATVYLCRFTESI